MRITQIAKRPYDNRILYDKTTVDLKEGINILCGCNGSGKTTLLKTIERKIEDRCEKDNTIKLITFDDDGMDGRYHADKLFKAENFEGLVRDKWSSEGERRFDRLSYVISRVGQAVRDKYKTIVCLVDGIDSGLSIDLLHEYVDGLKYVEDRIKKDGVEFYFVMSTNQYEMTKDFRNIDITTLKDISFKDYEEYKNFIMNSKEEKDRRIDASS